MDKEKGQPVDKVREELDIVLTSKMEEFILLGYDRVTKDDIWNCLVKKTWKDVKEDRAMYQVVNDVLSLSITDYMNYVSLHAHQESPEWFFQQFQEE